MSIAGETLGQGAVAENALDRGLGVIEVAFHGGHLHVGAGLRGHLQLLDLGDLAFRVEDGDGGARGVREAGQRGLAGVAGGGGENHDLLVRVAVGWRGVRHETRQNLQGHILECGGWTVEQFEHVIVTQRLQWSDTLVGPLLAIGIGDAPAQFLGGEVRQQRAQHFGGDLLVGLARQRGDIHLGLAQCVRDEQAAVVGNALTNRLLGGQRIGGAASGMEGGSHG